MAYDRKKFNQIITKILKSVKRGDKNKMDELFSMTFNHFYGYALVKLWNKDKAEDAVMTMYEHVMKYISSFDPSKGGVGWLFTILNRIIYNLNAEEMNLKQHEQFVIDDNYIENINSMYETIDLDNAVSGLDETERVMIFLYYFERRTLKEIAEMLNISVSAVHKHKNQIIKKLKEFLI
ncbi:MAG: sigma-70 family RNA polymerase sigma factor [Clostridiales bacterium]|nr:sigma-70 family RNA polymerase sigma factor [Clostridiales bacterium]